MKTSILITLAVGLITLFAFFILNNYTPTQTPHRQAFDANAQALSNGLIVIDKRLIPEAGGREAGLYNEACAFCHDLPDPASHDEMEWAFVVNRMEELIIELKEREKRVLVPWDEGIRKGIVDYLARHAFEGMDPGALPNSPEKGAKLFKEVCSTCHTLPDPSMHSLDVWEYVVSKMQHFQQDMGLPVMTEGEVLALMEYIEACQIQAESAANKQAP